MRAGSTSSTVAGGEKKMEDKHVQSIGADDEDGGKHKEST